MDDISLEARIIQPAKYDDDIGVDYPCISILTLAGQTARVLPRLDIPIKYCPFCGKEL